MGGGGGKFHASQGVMVITEETGVPGENNRPVTDKLYLITLYRVHFA